LREVYSGQGTALRYDGPFQLLVATVLSAQCTDDQVNRVTPVLFGRFPDARALASAQPGEVEQIIHSTGFFRQKARSIQAIARALDDRFNGRVPTSMEDLTSLPGVGRKTANLVRGLAFGLPGLIVDTHFRRVANRLGLAATLDPTKIEMAVADLLPAEQWTDFSNALIWHGRRFCLARAPRCANCPALADCPYGRAQIG